jgi:hypothetical protein
MHPALLPPSPAQPSPRSPSHPLTLEPTSSSTRSAAEARLYLTNTTPLEAMRSVFTYSRPSLRDDSSSWGVEGGGVVGGVVGRGEVGRGEVGAGARRQDLGFRQAAPRSHPTRRHPNSAHLDDLGLCCLGHHHKQPRARRQVVGVRREELVRDARRRGRAAAGRGVWGGGEGACA